MTLDTLRSLQARIRNSVGPDRELDAQVVCALLAPDRSYVEQSEINGAWCVYSGLNARGRPRLWVPPIRHSEFTASLDACVALQSEVLPGYEREVLVRSRRTYLALRPEFGTPSFYDYHALETHAHLLAILAAVIAREEAKMEKTA